MKRKARATSTGTRRQRRRQSTRKEGQEDWEKRRRRRTRSGIDKEDTSTTEKNRQEQRAARRGSHTLLENRGLWGSTHARGTRRCARAGDLGQGSTSREQRSKGAKSKGAESKGAESKGAKKTKSREQRSKRAESKASTSRKSCEINVDLLLISYPESNADNLRNPCAHQRICSCSPFLWFLHVMFWYRSRMGTAERDDFTQSWTINSTIPYFKEFLWEWYGSRNGNPTIWRSLEFPIDRNRVCMFKINVRRYILENYTCMDPSKNNGLDKGFSFQVFKSWMSMLVFGGVPDFWATTFGDQVSTRHISGSIW